MDIAKKLVLHRTTRRYSTQRWWFGSRSVCNREIASLTHRALKSLALRGDIRCGAIMARVAHGRIKAANLIMANLIMRHASREITGKERAHLPSA
jgi:hypothetical protein